MESSRLVWAKFERPSLKNKNAGSMTQVVEYLPIMCKTLGLISNTTKKEKKEGLYI
jgi:hypothetical protein